MNLERSDYSIPIFSQFIGSAWRTLSFATRKRFSCRHSTIFKGEMSEVRCSTLGWFFAQVCRLCGTPLVYRQGTKVRTEVMVYPTDNDTGIVWERRYHFDTGVVIARSIKTYHRELGLLECTTAGLGMMLKVTIHAGVIYFVSQSYFLRLLGCHVTLPVWISPGHTVVTHRDLGNGLFEFTLRIVHPLFGETFYQAGTFADDSVKC